MFLPSARQLVPMLAASALALSPLKAIAADTTATIDWTRAEARVNRGLFSMQGYMQVYVEPNPLVRETFELLNPRGTQTRLETYIHQMEPENDNDDPNTFDWERLHPEKMIRFIEDRPAFERDYSDVLGMEPLSLLCYSAGWLMPNKQGNTVQDVPEWVEFAAAVVESYNGRGADYRLNKRLVQIWNEPNMGMFYTGSMDTYFDLFNQAAARIHRDYPGVLVGGPSITHSGAQPEVWMRRFIEICGPNADYLIFQHYDDQVTDPRRLADSLARYATEFRKLPGRERGQVMITETDGRFDGWPKMQYLLQRQFAFLDIRELVMGVQHFCAMSYDESGNYEYGFVNPSGGMLPHNFWPYWLFRNYIGFEAHTQRTGPRAADLNLAASTDRDVDRFVATAILHNDSAEPMSVRAHLFFPAEDTDRILAFNRVTAEAQGIDRLEMIPAGAETMELGLEMEPGEALALNLLQPGQRHFAFRDLNNQEYPWIESHTDARTVDMGDKFTITASLLNTTTTEVNGELELRGLPAGWTSAVVDGWPQVNNLPFGDRHQVVFEVSADTLHLGGRIGPYVALSEGDPTIPLDLTAHSIPVTIDVVKPLIAEILPLPVQAVPGETNMVELQISNKSAANVTGTFELTLPEGFTLEEGAEKLGVEGGKRVRFPFGFRVGEDIAAGSHTGTLTMTVANTRIERPFTIEVSNAPVAKDAIPIDLSQHLNFDAVSFIANTTDFDRESMGAFVYPADYTPSDRVVSIRGVPWRLADLSDGKKNVILPRGQKIAVPEDVYTGVSMTGFGHDGKHPGTWVLHYADGTSESIDSQIPEWCTPPPEGFQVAMTAPFRYWQTGPAPPACELFTWTLPTAPGKKLVAVEFPTFERGAYVFAMTLMR